MHGMDGSKKGSQVIGSPAARAHLSSVHHHPSCASDQQPPLVRAAATDAKMGNGAREVDRHATTTHSQQSRPFRQEHSNLSSPPVFRFMCRVSLCRSPPPTQPHLITMVSRDQPEDGLTGMMDTERRTKRLLQNPHSRGAK
mmetsp:Transcript_48085/g.120412  ORF Transcript_48085/g.120412 Transcript_48085/m.120412 type:complete len:141 (+) Transcript_48085:1127-1549(+)